MTHQPSSKLLFLATLLLFSWQPVFAQFGVAGFYNISQDKLSYDGIEERGVVGSGYEVSLDYWFRLPTKRIEFLPTISYGNYSGQVNGLPNQNEQDVDYALTELGVRFNTNFYLFDFGTDCDCPTWGKQGPALHKGFFLQVAPGFSYFIGEASNIDPEQVAGSFEQNQGLFNLGLGAGIDFGVSNLITITPQLGYRHYFGEFDWTETIDASGAIFATQPSRAGTFSKLSFGLRVGIRLDERRY